MVTFEIVKIITERRINGNTTITAKCVQDETMITVTIPSIDIENKEIVKAQLVNQYLIKQYHDNLKLKKENEMTVGTIL